jgi:hypothetical protein
VKATDSAEFPIGAFEEQRLLQFIVGQLVAYWYHAEKNEQGVLWIPV